MSAGLLSQLDTYYSWIDEAQNPIHPDEVAALIDSPVRELQIPVPANPRRGWLVAVASAAVVLILVGGLALLTRVGGTESPVATTPPTDPVSLSTWSRVPHDEAVFGGEGDQGISSVTVGGPGLVAVGWDGSNAAVWTSVDGLTWSRVPHNEAVFGGESNVWMDSVIVGGPGLVASGWDEGDGSTDDLLNHQNPALWISVDGVTWSRVSPDEDVLEGGGFQDSPPRAVTAGGPGLVAVGENDQGAVVWTSADGLTWSRVPHNEAVFGLALGAGNAMTAVTTGGPGLVAVGSDGLNSDGPTGFARAVVWTSVDGLSWSRLAHDEAVFGGEGDQGMFDVTVGGPGLVAVGEDDQGAPVWTSVDGVTWSRVPRDEAVFGGQWVRIFHVTVGGPGLVAVGENDQGAVVWTSVDGVTWSLVPRDETVFGGPDVEVFDVTVGGPGQVAVGWDRSNGSNAAVWVAAADG